MKEYKEALAKYLQIENLDLIVEPTDNIYNDDDHKYLVNYESDNNEEDDKVVEYLVYSESDLDDLKYDIKYSIIEDTKDSIDRKLPDLYDYIDFDQYGIDQVNDMSFSDLIDSYVEFVGDIYFEDVDYYIFTI